ncbi:MAG: hypothetical protein QXH03_07795 [Candidatus Bathyarchaeia archaeon]
MQVFLIARIVKVVVLIILLALSGIFILSIARQVQTGVSDTDGDGDVDMADMANQMFTENCEKESNPFGQMAQAWNGFASSVGDGISNWDYNVLAYMAANGASTEALLLTYAGLASDSLNPLTKVNSATIINKVCEYEVLKGTLGENGAVATLITEEYFRQCNAGLGISKGQEMWAICAGAVASGNTPLAVFTAYCASYGGIDGNPYTPW